MMYEDSLDSDADLEQAEPAPDRPANVPEKFWDPKRGEIRVEALLRAYRDLERRSSSLSQPSGAPASPEDYNLETSHPMLASCPEVNRRLHEAGFTQEQAQLVYDLAHDTLMPVVDKAGGQDPRQSQIEHLRDHFGGETRWRQMAPQLSAWGKRNLPPEAYQALASSADGVKALHRLMASGEPNLGRSPAPRDEAPSEDSLKKMIQDPRYWKQRDPAFIAKVSAGFRRIYGEN